MIPYTVTIGDFLADNHDDDDFRITANLTGWGSAPIRLGVSDKTQQDGGWLARSYRGQRIISIDGEVDQPSHEAAMAVAEQLRSIPLEPVQVIVDHETLGPRTAMALLEVGAEPQWFTATYFKYSLQFRAPDPLLYGPEVFSQTSATPTAGSGGRVWPRVWPTDWGVAPGVTPGAVTLGNVGTASYFPRIRLENRWVNPVLTVPETGDWLRIGRTIEAGQHVDINWGTPRRVTVGDNPISIRHQVTYSGNFLAIPAGGASLVVSSDDASTDAVMSVWSYEGAYE